MENEKLHSLEEQRNKMEKAMFDFYSVNGFYTDEDIRVLFTINKKINDINKKSLVISK